MSSLSNEKVDHYVTCDGTSGAEIFRVFSKITTSDGFTFDGENYSEMVADNNYPKFTSGYGVFVATPGIVSGRLVWVGKKFESASGNILSVDDDLIWIDFTDK